jgi:D-sedoheptulose 7-phosphate isomerase
MDLIRKSLNESLLVLKSFIENDSNLHSIKAAGDIMVNSLRNGSRIISFGNGGSMSDAMHFAEELTGRFRDDRPAISAISISDPTHISCVANDYGFDAIFSRFIEANGRKGDVVLAISTSGNSANVIKAAEAAKAKGIRVVALTGKTGGKLASLADVEIRVAHTGYSDRIQEVHIKVIHILIEYIEKRFLERST